MISQSDLMKLSQKTDMMSGTPNAISAPGISLCQNDPNSELSECFLNAIFSPYTPCKNLTQLMKKVLFIITHIIHCLWFVDQHEVNKMTQLVESTGEVKNCDGELSSSGSMAFSGLSLKSRLAQAIFTIVNHNNTLLNAEKYISTYLQQNQGTDQNM